MILLAMPTIESLRRRRQSDIEPRLDQRSPKPPSAPPAARNHSGLRSHGEWIAAGSQAE